jgi:predicted ATPase
MITMTVQRRGGELPAETTRLVGRRKELAELARLCESSRLVTVTGVGGVGKTRLALRAAAELRPRFTDGVCWVELSALEDDASVPYAIAAALPLVDQTVRPMIDVVADYLAGRELLVVLDTCEHLAAACSLVIQDLLASAPGLRILATSRRVLGVPSEQVLTLDPLPVPDPGTAAGPSEDAVMLLADRAALVVPGFQVNAAGWADVVRLCQRLDGLPLAIELAAARLDELPLAELTRRLEDRFALLGDTESITSRADPPWHQSLRTAIGWSHELCSPAERLAWARLSVFAGGFEQEAAQWVCADRPLSAGQLPGLLSALVDASVLQRSDTPRGDRYSMLDTIREYGQAWARDLGEDQALRDRHRSYFRSLARRAAENWMAAGQLAWYERCTAEHANLRLALDACLADPDPRPALGMAGSLWFFWNCGGLGREGFRYLDRALAAAPDPVHAPERFWALWACAVLEVNRGNPEALIGLDETCGPLADRLGDRAAIAVARIVKAWRLTLTGQHQPAIEFLGDVSRWPGQGAGLLTARLLGLSSISFSHVLLGQFDQAAATAGPLLEECEQLGEHWVRGFAHYFLAMAALGNGEYAAAIQHACGAIEIKWRLHDVFGAATAVDTLAPATAVSDPARAARLLGISDTLWHTIGEAQFGVAELIAVRQACERQIRDALGDTAYQDAHEAGRDMRLDEGIAYALHAG